MARNRSKWKFWDKEEEKGFRVIERDQRGKEGGGTWRRETFSDTTEQSLRNRQHSSMDWKQERYNPQTSDGKSYVEGERLQGKCKASI